MLAQLHRGNSTSNGGCLRELSHVKSGLLDENRKFEHGISILSFLLLGKRLPRDKNGVLLAGVVPHGPEDPALPQPFGHPTLMLAAGKAFELVGLEDDLRRCESAAGRELIAKKIEFVWNIGHLGAIGVP